MSEPRTRLDEAMSARSLQIKKRWVQIADEAGISTAGLGGIRRGEYKPNPHTARALEDALQWEYGSIDAVLDGGDPTAREQRVPIGQAEAEVNNAAQYASDAAAEGDDPKMQRAMELLAEATAMLEEVRRERREGA